MIDTSLLLSGDILPVRVRWSWKTLPTYVSRAINFFINLWAGIITFFSKYNKKIKPIPYCPWNHIIVFVRHLGREYVYESIGKGFLRWNAADRLKDFTLDNIWCIRYENIDRARAYEVCESMVGIPYGYGIIGEQIISQLSNEKITFKWNESKGMVCSISGARAINLLNPKFCKDWSNYDPQDFLLDENKIIISLKLAL